MKTLRSVFLIIGISFSGIAFAIFWFATKPELDAKCILKNGTETTATVVNVGSNLTKGGDSKRDIKGTSYYYVELYFINDRGEKIEAKTGSFYLKSFLDSEGIIPRSTVPIMYKDNIVVIRGGEVEQSFELYIAELIFCLVGIVCLIAFMLNILKINQDLKIKQSGKSGIGVYLTHHLSYIINGEPHYKIFFTFKNDNGEIIETKTSQMYRGHEVNVLESMQSFPIRYIGDKAVIMLDKNKFFHQRHIEKIK